MSTALHKGKGRQMAALRALVEEKFPQAPLAPVERLRTGCTLLDEQGGLRKGSVTEICGSAVGSQMILSALLDVAVREGFFVGMIDGANAFNPADWRQDQLGRMLWVMAGKAEPALKAADLLLRDGNLPVLLLDLQIVPVRQLNRIPASTWHRFQRVIEQSANILAVLTPEPMIEGAPTRIVTRMKTTLASMNRPRVRVWEHLSGQLYERGGTTAAPLRVVA
ncbi:hypothetical protein BH09VER1_BH09VER1_38270 [soil metagenome]